MNTVYTKSPDQSTADNAPSFAEQAARDAFGRDYVHPLDRAFEDREPWQRGAENRNSRIRIATFIPAPGDN